MMACPCRSSIRGRPTVGVARCRFTVLRVIDIGRGADRPLVTHVDLWPANGWGRSGVESRFSG